MTNNTITADSIVGQQASAVVNMVKGQLSREGKVYPDYIDTHGVTRDNLAEHVKALREIAFPGVKASSRAERGTAEYRAHTFASKVRNGLSRHLPDAAPKNPAENYVTPLGLKAENREAFLVRCAAEWDAKNGA